MLCQFSLGHVVATPNAIQTLTESDIKQALRRHQACDWGDVSSDDAETNDRAVVNRSRLLSAYHSASGLCFWVITTARRAQTMICLPSEVNAVSSI
jgi:hypothetical protein